MRAMRIIAGEAKGRRIKAPRGRATRPMRDFVREAVFSMLGGAVARARVLDLFAGSGSLGLEALSRGAREAMFVDRGREAGRIIKENLETLGMAEKGKVIRAEVLDYLRKARFPENGFNLIFIDPPYRIDLGYRQEMLKRLAEGGFLAPSAVVIIEAPLRSSPPGSPEGVHFRERRKYGETAVDVYVREENTVRIEEGAASDMKVAICPGTFDPITCGHLDVINRACKYFDRFIVGVAANPFKQPLFTLEERTHMLEKATAELDNVEVTPFDTLLVDFARTVGATAIVKGLRAISDFEYEFQMAQINQAMDEEVETFFVMANPEYTFISSSAVREVASYGGSISGLVPRSLEQELIEMFASKFDRLKKGAV